MMEEKRMVRWTNEERALLAHFVRVAVEENGKSTQEALSFAAIKLGRSKAACQWQYQNYVSKDKYVPLTIEEEQINTENTLDNTIDLLRQELAYSQDLVHKLMTERSLVHDAVLSCMSRNTWNLKCILEDTGKITFEDVDYLNSLIERIFNYKYFRQ